MQPPGQQEMSRLAAEERHGACRFDRRAHHRAGGAVHAARQIDRDDRHAAGVHRLDHRRGRPSTSRSRPAPNSASMMRSQSPERIRRSRLDRPAPALRGQSRVALEPLAIADETDAHRRGRARPDGARRQIRRRHYCPGRPPRRRDGPRGILARQHRRRRGRRSPSSAMPGTPPAIASRSASAISAVVSNSIIARKTIGRLSTDNSASHCAPRRPWRLAKI